MELGSGRFKTWRWKGKTNLLEKASNASALRKTLKQACQPPFVIEELGSC